MIRRIHIESSLPSTIKQEKEALQNNQQIMVEDINSWRQYPKDIQYIKQSLQSLQQMSRCLKVMSDIMIKNQEEKINKKTTHNSHDKNSSSLSNQRRNLTSKRYSSTKKAECLKTQQYKIKVSETKIKAEKEKMIHIRSSFGTSKQQLKIKNSLFETQKKHLAKQKNYCNNIIKPIRQKNSQVTKKLQKMKSKTQEANFFLEDNLENKIELQKINQQSQTILLNRKPQKYKNFQSILDSLSLFRLSLT